MKIVTEISTVLDNGNKFVYAITDNGTAFTKIRQCKNEDEEDFTNEKLWAVLDSLIQSKDRVRVWYGDVKTGCSWNEEYDVTGYIGRSCGFIKCPLMINNSRSYGGPALLDDAIIRIDRISDKKTLYAHDSFHCGDFWTKKDDTYADYPFAVWNKKDDGTTQNVANFKTITQADRYIQFMTGKRYSK